MEHHEKAGCLFPKIGMRNVKTALAAALCALVYYFLDRNPTFACIGAIFGMGSSFMQSRLHGGNRFFGTMVGGFIGMGLFAIYMELFPDGSNAWVLIPLTFVGVIILILLCQHIWVGGVQPGGVCIRGGERKKPCIEQKAARRNFPSRPKRENKRKRSYLCLRS